MQNLSELFAEDPDFLDIEEEGLFARDYDGQLIRVEQALATDYETDINLKIDGQAITVKKAVPLTDSQGKILRDADGSTTPRFTTIYDAASRLFVQSLGDQNPIPILCHQEHLAPAGVCRVCVVEVFRESGGTRRGGGKLVPACHHRVEEGMDIETIQSSGRVRESVTLLTELLVSEHLTDDESSTGPVKNELERLAGSLGIEASRFTKRKQARSQDNSSHLIMVDHSACILCDRCTRSCTDVKHNDVIGRTGKGYATTIGFDLNLPMQDSSCVTCGECAIACPTNALTFREEELARRSKEILSDIQLGPTRTIVSAEELIDHRLFRGIPFKFLQFNSGAVVRWKVKKGEVLCREGEYGNTAFIIESGRLEILLESKSGSVHTEKAAGFWGKIGKLSTSLLPSAATKSIPVDGGSRLDTNERMYRERDDVLVGEMTCMNRYPRSATVVAAEDGEVLEIRRNVLYLLQRNRTSRDILDDVYRKRALQTHLTQLSLFQDLADDERERCVEFLRDRIDLLSVEPGQTIIQQGDRAEDFFLVRLGYVKVFLEKGGQRQVVNYLGPGKFFGELGLLGDVVEVPEELLSSGYAPGTRIATCAALDHVELVRLRNADFQQLIADYPSIAAKLINRARKVVAEEAKRKRQMQGLPSSFVDEGLYLANSLLVLDLNSCTRCDECTRACADTHLNITRLIREGMRFGDYLVASSCRSCQDPYCLVGCPVDAIHRDGDSFEIQIEDHCIGCGLCADNCPYGNINMHDFGEQRRKATTCDLCRNVVGPNQQTSCVYACPHEAAFRKSGEELLQLVLPEGFGRV